MFQCRLVKSQHSTKCTHSLTCTIFILTSTLLIFNINRRQLATGYKSISVPIQIMRSIFFVTPSAHMDEWPWRRYSHINWHGSQRLRRLTTYQILAVDLLWSIILFLSTILTFLILYNLNYIWYGLFYLAIVVWPPWAHCLGGYQDRLLGGSLGLLGMCHTAPDGVGCKDYGGEVLG
jgi:hypothetical protein